ncbi:MAG: SLBB domain-containing protein [Pyrinomonadaceae bacterium]
MKTLSYFLLASAYVVALAAGTKTASAQASSQIGCHEIAIIGAVKTPARLKIPGRIRLLEALTGAGGPTERAGKVVRVIHSCKCSPCNEGVSKTPDSNEYYLADVLRGEAHANPEVAAGALIIVPEAEMVFVIGNGIRSKSLVYREGMTLTRAIAMVGGVAQNSDLVNIRIYRDSSSRARSNPLIFTLRAVLRNRNEDPVLQPQDILEISDESGNFRSPFSPIFLDPPLMRPTGDPSLIQRRSLNC